VLAALGWPVLDRIRLGPIAISPHGLGIAIGYLIGAQLLLRIGPRRIVRDDGSRTAEELARERARVRRDLESMAVWAIVGTIVGARLFYVIAHYSEFDGILDMLAVHRGGISLLGGIAGAVLINVPRMRKLGYRFFEVMDPAVICIALGIAIGRIGDLVIGDHLGKPTSWLLAWTYRGGSLAPPFDCVSGTCTATLQNGFVETISREGATLVDPAGATIAQGVGVHQTALYDIVGAWPLFAVLWFLAKGERRLGVLTLTFGAWYGAMRVVTDFLRIDKRFFGLTGSQWTAATVATLSLLTLLAWAMAGERAVAERAGSPDARDEGG
jgi:prolipoprotein diacylglyceryltransferase